MSKVVLLGGGGHARSIVAMLSRIDGYEPVGYTATTLGGIKDLPYLGNDSILPMLFNQGIRQAILAVGSVGPNLLRRKIWANLKTIGFELPVVVAGSAIIAADVEIGEGTVIFENVVVNARSRIGKCAIINTAAVVEHDCLVGDFVHLAPAAAIGGGVNIESDAHIGIHATVIENRKIGSKILIGAGAVVSGDCFDSGIYLGIPARKIRELPSEEWNG